MHLLLFLPYFNLISSSILEHSNDFSETDALMESVANIHLRFMQKRVCGWVGEHPHRRQDGDRKLGTGITFEM